MPIRMNPMIGLTRNRAKGGMTIPAVPRITSASLKPDVLNSPSIASLKQADPPLSLKCLRLIGWRHDVKETERSRPDRRRRWAGGHDGGAAVCPRRLQGASAREGRGLPARFLRGHPPPPDAGTAPRARPHRRVPEAAARRSAHADGASGGSPDYDRRLEPPSGREPVRGDDAAVGVPRLPRRRGAALSDLRPADGGGSRRPDHRERSRD